MVIPDRLNLNFADERPRGADESGITFREGAHADPDLRAETKLALAEALWAGDDDRPRAIRLAEAARDQFPDARAADRQRAVELLAAIGCEVNHEG